MPEAQKKGWQMPQGDFRIHSASFFLFIFSLLIFSGVYIYKMYVLPKQISGLEKQQADLTQKIKDSLSDDLVAVGRKANNAKVLLKDHLYWSKYFEILEKFTLKNISYDQFTVKPDSAKSTVIKAEVSGHTDNFALLSKQIAVLMSRSEFLGVKFNGGEMDKDGIIKFKIGIDINQDMIKEKNSK